MARKSSAGNTEGFFGKTKKCAGRAKKCFPRPQFPQITTDVSEPITFFNRRTGSVETEKIYGEGPMRFVYENPVGRLALWAVARRAFFSRWFGWRMRKPASVWRIRKFITDYALDPAEFAGAVDSFKSFDDFFSRKLKPGARPIAGDDGIVVFPADGRHLGFQNISAVKNIYAKGQAFDLPALLGDAALAAKYAGGAIVCSRLCPVDYHRFHFPVAGVASAPRLVNGWLYSVSPVALRRNVNYLWENKRAVLTIKTKEFGDVCLVVIGATNVGGMTFTYPENNYAGKGEEAGFFSFGGSFVATLFEPGKIKLAEDLTRESAAGRELYAKMGTLAGNGIISGS